MSLNAVYMYQHEIIVRPLSDGPSSAAWSCTLGWCMLVHVLLVGSISRVEMHYVYSCNVQDADPSMVQCHNRDQPKVLLAPSLQQAGTQLHYNDTIDMEF